MAKKEAVENGENIKALAAGREKTIIRTSIIGIIANVFLSAFKAGVGFISNSVAIILDAVNNLSDALSSVITIIGTKLASKKPDKKHPLGHGRIEYITEMIIAAIVLYAGVTSLVESIKKIIEPETPDHSVWSFVIISAAVFVKIFLGLYFKKTGKKVNSGSLIASGSDALFDAIISVSVLASAVFFIITKINVEAYLGVLISAYIIKSGISLIAKTLNNILGTRTDKEFALEIKKTVCSDPDVHGAFDLYLYNYGPDQNYGSVHVDDTMTAAEIDAMNRRIQTSVYVKHGVILTGIGIYAINTGSDEAGKMRKKIMETVMAHDYSMQFHGFYVDLEQKKMTFDVVLSFDCDPAEAIEEMQKEISALYPDYEIRIRPDIDITE